VILNIHVSCLKGWHFFEFFVERLRLREDGRLWQAVVCALLMAFFGDFADLRRKKLAIFPRKYYVFITIFELLQHDTFVSESNETLQVYFKPLLCSNYFLINFMYMPSQKYAW
jgi:hypothetical protein